MKRLVLVLFFTILAVSLPTRAQEEEKWNFNIGGGIGFPLSHLSNYVNNGANFVVGGGINVNPALGFDSEFMWHDLPIKRSVLDQLGAPGGSARQYALTFNGILRLPVGRRFGTYVIGGPGWYHRSGELTTPTLVPGTVCPPFWIWWGGCVNGLFPANKIIASSSSNAFGANVGLGFTVGLSEHLKFYTEVRYHYAPHAGTSTELLPLTFGLRW